MSDGDYHYRRLTKYMDKFIEKLYDRPMGQCGNGHPFAECDCFNEKEPKECEPEDDGSNGLSDAERNR